MLGLKREHYVSRRCMKFCMSSMAWVVVLGWAAGALGQQTPDAGRVPTKRFRLDVAPVCDSLPLAWPAWCPHAQAGVAGGAYREFDVSAGDTIDFDCILILLQPPLTPPRTLWCFTTCS